MVLLLVLLLLSCCCGIVDGTEIDAVGVCRGDQVEFKFRDFCLPGSSAPSSIHSDRSHNSDGVVSDESSVLASVDVQSRVRMSVSGADTVRAENDELWNLPDNSGLSDTCLKLEDVQLNETLKSLLETKTPMLPSRLRTVLKPQQHKQQSVSCVEPSNVSRHRVGSDNHWTSSKHSRYSLPRQSVDTDSQSDAEAELKASMVIEFHNGSYRQFAEKSPSKHSASERRIVDESRAAGVVVGDKKSIETDVQSLSSVVLKSTPDSCADATAESELLKCSVDLVSSPRLTLPGTDSLDSLIARYQNLRDSSAVDRTSSGQMSGSRAGLDAVHSSCIGVAMLNSTEATNTSRFVPQQSAVCVLDAADLEDDLCNDNFDDIRCSLQNISMDSDHTPLHASSQPKGLFCAYNNFDCVDASCIFYFTCVHFAFSFVCSYSNLQCLMVFAVFCHF